jgi:type IV pilus assembly protein PilW
MSNKRRHRRPRGFSLIELLVGLVIGMIAVIVMMQVLSVSEANKRTTTGGDDAQNNGAIALYSLQRDMRQAGYGINAFSVIGCNLTLRAGVTANALGPVVINHASIPAGDPNTDTLLVAYGAANDGPEGDLIAAQPAQTTYNLAGFTSVGGAPSVAVGDNVVAQSATRPSPCTLSVEAVTAVANSNVTVGTGVLGMTGGALFNLGQAPTVLAYAVRNGNLTVCNYIVSNCGGAFNAAQWVSLASNVVSLRAEYGRDTSAPMDGTVDVFDQTQPATACAWVRMRAARVVVVARSAQLEKDNVTTVAPTWAGSGTTPIDVSKNPDGTANPDWQRYRYKVFETVVPLRNMAWMGVQAGC